VREAVAAGDHDFVLSEPASKLRHFWQRLYAPKQHAARRPSRRGRRLASFLAAGFFVAISAIILFNALVWQKNRHPAPLLFSRMAPAAPANGAKYAGAPVPRRAQPAVSQDETHEKLPQNLPQTHANVPTSAPHDQISELLQARPSSPPPSKPAAGAPKPPQPAKAVLNAQRAFIKLGFVLNADGVEGPATRKAIARFERDHGLPLRGKLTPALVRTLSAEAGNFPN
jgi:hypothetical protein